jgi:hypothetical protein
MSKRMELFFSKLIRCAPVCLQKSAKKTPRPQRQEQGEESISLCQISIQFNSLGKHDVILQMDVKV